MPPRPPALDATLPEGGIAPSLTLRTPQGLALGESRPGAYPLSQQPTGHGACLAAAVWETRAWRRAGDRVLSLDWPAVSGGWTGRRGPTTSPTPQSHTWTEDWLLVLLSAGYALRVLVPGAPLLGSPPRSPSTHPMPVPPNSA